MKTLLIMFGLMLAGAAHAQTFEGKVVYKMEIAGLPAGANSEQMAQFIPKQQITYYKEGATRVETIGGMMQMSIVTPASGEGVWMINDDQKKVLVMDKAQVEKQVQEAKSMKVVTKKTTETRTIAGHPCVKYVITMTSAKADAKKIESVIWAATDITVKKAAVANPSDFFGKDIPGLALLTTVQQGPMNILLTATEVKAMPLEESLFTKPAGYSVEPFSQAAMMKGLR